MNARADKETPPVPVVAYFDLVKAQTKEIKKRTSNTQYSWKDLRRNWLAYQQSLTRLIEHYETIQHSITNDILRGATLS